MLLLEKDDRLMST